MGDDTFLGLIAMAVIAAIGVITELMWLSGQLASAVSGGGWPRTPHAGLAFRIMLHLLAHGTVSPYWPEEPGWLFWVIYVVLLAVPVAAAFPVTRWVLEHSQPAGARWGGAAVERRLAAPEDPAARPGRFIAGTGQATKQLVGGGRNLSAIAFGIPGSQKTAGLVIPTVVDWVGPSVMTTVKAADLDPIRAAKPQNFFVVAPAGIADGYPAHRWSPVDYCVDAKSADRMATWFAESASNSDDDRSAVWIDQAVPIIKGMLYAANLERGGVEMFRRWLQQGRFASEDVYAVLMKHAQLVPAGASARLEREQTAYDYINPWRSLHGDGIGSIQLTLNVIAKVYADEEVRQASSGTDVDAKRLLDTGGTLCLVAPEGDTQRYAPLFTAIIASVIHEAESRFKDTGIPLDPPLALVVDEAGNFLKYKKLPNVLTTGRGGGICVLTIWHDLSQLRSSYGEQNAGTIINASPLRMLLPGNADLPTLQLFNQLLGKALVQRRSVSQGGGYSRAQHQLSLQETELAPLHELAQLEDGTAIVLYSNLRPFKVRMRPWFADKAMLARIPTERVRQGGQTIVKVIAPARVQGEGAEAGA